jgi:hypothetical protein
MHKVPGFNPSTKKEKTKKKIYRFKKQKEGTPNGINLKKFTSNQTCIFCPDRIPDSYL